MLDGNGEVATGMDEAASGVIEYVGGPAEVHPEIKATKTGNAGHGSRHGR